MFKKYWANEHLAALLLSRITFMSSPLKPPDDIGVDLMCTLFEAVGGNLLPKSSFALQVKSSSRPFKFSSAQYLEKLEVPFFVGVPRLDTVSLELYSGDSIPLFFSKVGLANVERLEIEPVAEVPPGIDSGWRKKRRSQGSFTIYLPLVAKLSLDDSDKRTLQAYKQLLSECWRVQYNLSSRRVHQHIYLTKEPDIVTIMAGSGSAQTFKRNFHWRLAEVFKNLLWIGENCQQDLSLRECEIFFSFYEELRAHSNPVPIVEPAYAKLREFIARIPRGPTGPEQFENPQEETLPTGADFADTDHGI